jgi:hypothetical protein
MGRANNVPTVTEVTDLGHVVLTRAAAQVARSRPPLDPTAPPKYWVPCQAASGSASSEAGRRTFASCWSPLCLGIRCSLHHVFERVVEVLQKTVTIVITVIATLRGARSCDGR